MVVRQSAKVSSRRARNSRESARHLRLSGRMRACTAQRGGADQPQQHRRQGGDQHKHAGGAQRSAAHRRADTERRRRGGHLREEALVAAPAVLALDGVAPAHAPDPALAQALLGGRRHQRHGPSDAAMLCVLSGRCWPPEGVRPPEVAHRSRRRPQRPRCARSARTPYTVPRLFEVAAVGCAAAARLRAVRAGARRAFGAHAPRAHPPPRPGCLSIEPAALQRVGIGRGGRLVVPR